ncbi:MAG: hypothetical protein CME59_18490 [Halioglobus sp.]|nr:hypothetical protein [Halioglobus sp.]
MVIDLLIDRYGQIALNDSLMRRIAKVRWGLTGDTLLTRQRRLMDRTRLLIRSLRLDAHQQCSDQHNNQKEPFH